MAGGVLWADGACGAGKCTKVSGLSLRWSYV